MMASPDRIRDALQFIDPSDRETWVRMAFAIKDEIGDIGFELWDSWSQRADNYKPTSARDVWKSAKQAGPVRIGSLFHEAKANGWHGDSGYGKPASDELAERRRIATDREAQQVAQIERERAEAAHQAKAIWNAATEAQADHPYLLRKRIPPVVTIREIDAGTVAGILRYIPKSSGKPFAGRLLVVPVEQGDGLSTLELIDSEGRKTALAGRGTKAGGYWATQELPESDGSELTLLIGEGVATVLSAAEATGHIGIAALSSGNLTAVASAMRRRYPAAALVILADLVKGTGAPDPHAIEAARSSSGTVAIPRFNNRNSHETDFNDMAVRGDAEAVRVSIAYASAPTDSPGEWPQPQPLTAKFEPLPYPLDALPDTIRAAVEEVAAFTKAPVPLVAGSALAVLSIAAQAHIDVIRAEKLLGPSSLYLLTIADSGERKSTCDGFFVSAIRQYQEEQAEAMKPAIKEYQAAIAAWEAERDGILAAIKGAGRTGKATDKLKRDLAELQRDKPELPRVPRLLLGDETPENLAWGLAKHWPSAGVVSAEAGIVFGAHGMGKDSVMRNLGLLNVLWDGGSHSVGRRTSESFTVKGARLTVALQIQEVTLRSFFDRSGGLARGTGFLARFLVAWPESTQGHRHFTEAPPHWPNLSAFHKRIAGILANPAPLDEEGALSPALMILAPEAKNSWIAFHNAIESELGSGGELYDVRDVASKSADNAARLSALFQLFEYGAGAIRRECFDSASRIAAWHLSESRRFFGELALPAEVAGAARLDLWLAEFCRRERVQAVSTRDMQRLGPIRDKEKLAAALRELEELDRVRVVVDGRRKAIHLNPALIGATP